MKQDLIIEHGEDGIVKLKFEYNGNQHNLAEYDMNTDKLTIKKDKYTPYNQWNEMVQYVESFEDAMNHGAHIHRLVKEITEIEKEISSLKHQISQYSG